MSLLQTKVKVLELFAGSRSFTKVAMEHGCKTYTTDIEPFEGIDQVCDIFDFDVDLAEKSLGGCPDIIWASPPCTYFSVASMGYHWNKNGTPKTKQAEFGISLIKQTKKIIEYFKNLNKELFYIIENPRGKLRKLNLLDSMNIHTVTYCQYGDKRMKPTDLWSNIELKLKPMCKNGDDCHESAPRGSRTGTQGLKNPFERSKVPAKLCFDVLRFAIDNQYKNNYTKESFYDTSK
tara:strand:+ start:29 stop:730 length:702 start_codon:yes stop_codon:yes gene_type:complete